MGFTFKYTEGTNVSNRDLQIGLVTISISWPF